jgi:hypothetical protein
MKNKKPIPTTILQLLEYDEVLNVRVSDNKLTVAFTELCGRRFSTYLCKFQVEYLIKELQSIADSMEG